MILRRTVNTRRHKYYRAKTKEYGYALQGELSLPSFFAGHSYKVYSKELKKSIMRKCVMCSIGVIVLPQEFIGKKVEIHLPNEVVQQYLNKRLRHEND